MLVSTSIEQTQWALAPRGDRPTHKVTASSNDARALEQLAVTAAPPVPERDLDIGAASKELLLSNSSNKSSAFKTLESEKRIQVVKNIFIRDIQENLEVNELQKMCGGEKNNVSPVDVVLTP
jgi:hypothetical protein